ncbi:MAG: hypothetical protein R3B97_16640 [Dehalococcoidia bacterium]
MLVGNRASARRARHRELETYARMQARKVLWGRNHENSGAPAFWPWVQVGRHWGSTNDVASLSSFLAAGGGDLVRLFPELRGVAGFVEPAMQDGAAAQFRLFDAFAGFVRTISEQADDRSTTSTGLTSRRCSCCSTWRGTAGGGCGCWWSARIGTRTWCARIP